MHTATRATSKVTQEKVFVVSFWQPDARIIRQAGGAVADIRDRRQVVSGLSVLLRITHALRHPRPARIRLVDELKTNTPAAISTFDQINPSRRIPAVRIVFARPEVAVLVERQFLRIAQPTRENLEI